MDVIPTKIDEAILFATEAHMGQMRKGGKKPYILHPLEAASIAMTLIDTKTTSYEDTMDIVSATILHDVIEDTKYGSSDIREKFGDHVLFLVTADTENKREELPPEETWMVRKQETIDYTRNVATREQKVIIFSDKLSNLRSVFTDYLIVGDKIWDRFHVKEKRLHKWYYESFLETCKEFSGTSSYIEYKELCEKIF